MTLTVPIRRALAFVLLSTVIAACSTATTPTPSAGPCPSAAPTADEAAAINAAAARAMVTTNLGSFTIELYPQAAPIATANFVALARCGFYDGISFHRVIAGFVAQAGDPQTKANRAEFAGLGTGGPGFDFTIEPPADGYNYDQYVVAMANSGQPDSNGSQLFIDLADLDGRLARSYTIFGKVVAGTEVIDAIGAVATTPGDVPVQPIIIGSVAIESGS
jgi:Peptidyl-prolyl cis-trans isomerase (rotamase) - cyclophilin family